MDSSKDRITELEDRLEKLEKLTDSIIKIAKMTPGGRAYCKILGV